MKSTGKLIKRFAITLIVSLVVLLALNIILLVTVSSMDSTDPGGWKRAKRVAEQLEKGEDGQYELGSEGKAMLRKNKCWAILIQDGTGDVIWHSAPLPEEIPLHYSAAEISWYTRGYIEDYPTTTAAMGEDLVIVGNPKESYWKDMYPTFSLYMVKNVPRTFLTFAGVNFAMIVLIYMAATSGVIRSVKPIVQGIEALPEGEEVYIKEKGLLSDLAISINRVSEKLRSQEYVLEKKEQARASWISGVSHDIRTPLSMVMGYAAEIEEDRDVHKEARQKAGIIRAQSIRMKNLVGDLNLASKLEYNMQPVKPEPVDLTSLVRETVVEFMNMDMKGSYPAELVSGAGEGEKYELLGDGGLLKRAVENLLVNVQAHNPQGCGIWVKVFQEGQRYHILVEDDGVGVTEEQLERLRTTSHYLLSDGSAGNPRHGLGLLIVQQIAAVHGGEAVFGHSEQGGFRADIALNF